MTCNERNKIIIKNFLILFYKNIEKGSDFHFDSVDILQTS